jgi:hypothetical protein
LRGGEEAFDPTSREQAEEAISDYAGYDTVCQSAVLYTSSSERRSTSLWKCTTVGGATSCCETRNVPGGENVGSAECPRSREPSPGATAESPLPTPSPSDSSAAADLAAVELGFRPDSDDPTLLRIARELSAMAADCPSNTERELADYTANTLLQLEDAGLSPTPSEILADVRQSTSLREFSDCLDVFVLYATLRKGGG